MTNDQDIIASVVENQETGDLNEEVGQDEGQAMQEDSQEQESARYHQSRADKLAAELEQVKAEKSEKEKIGAYIESRPELAQKLLNEVSGTKDVQNQTLTLKPDEFDPWEAYNDPSSKSYKFRMQEMQQIANQTKQEILGDIQAQQGRTNLRSDLVAKGLNEDDIKSFFDFADKHPSEYGLDNVLKMWQAVTQSPETIKENPLDKVRQTQASPQAAGVLQGQQPERKNEIDEIWEGIKASGDNMKF